jgi:hypothetical protein
MWHPFPGFSGLVGGGLVFTAIGAVSFLTKEFETYDIDPQGKPGAFEPILAKYIKAAELVIGLATGSIVLLVGSSALHSQAGRLPWFYASPLILLAWSVISGVVFIVWVVHRYEGYQHGEKHTKLRYTISETLGFGSLICFGLGYFMLIFVVTH